MQNKIPDELLKIIRISIESVEPESIIYNNVRKDKNRLIFGEEHVYDLSKIKNIYIVGAGKAVVGMVKGLNHILGERITAGLIITKHIPLDTETIGHVRVFKGNHPVPGIESLESCMSLVEFTQRVTADDLVICLITGGGSALMTLPAEGISLSDLQTTTGLLLRCGASIDEMNVIRKHLDQIKGGGLARFLYPAHIMTLILSDVIGNPIDIIASGPTVPDDSTFHDTWKIIEKYALTEKIPDSVKQHIKKGIIGEVPETVKPNSQFTIQAMSLIIGDNRQACKTAIQKSTELGYNSLLLNTSLHGEAKEAGKFLSSILREIATSGCPVKRPACIVAGGETTVHIQGNGLGGRNLEMALGAVKELSGLHNIAFIPFATDGEDGPTDAAGAIVTGNTFDDGLAQSLHSDAFLMNNDSWHYFNTLGTLLKTGPTGTNVNDICFMFAY